MQEFLIKNTTREQREEIVRQSLGYSDVGCEECSGAYGYDMYQDYIDGKKELEEITAAFRANYVRGYMEKPEQNGCGYAK